MFDRRWIRNRDKQFLVFLKEIKEVIAKVKFRSSSRNSIKSYGCREYDHFAMNYSNMTSAKSLKRYNK